MTSQIYYIAFLLMFLLFGCGSGAKMINDDGPKTPLTIYISPKQIALDNLENIFVLTEQNDIIRYDNTYTELYTFDNNIDGEISSIDVTNPQKILCYIKTFNRIVQLDNTLYTINTINLNESDFLNVSAASMSNDNNIWIFDNAEQTLTKIDENANPIFISNRLSDYGLNDIDPILIKEKANRVVILDKDIGLIIFDNFGQYLKTIAEPQISDLQLFGAGILFVKDGKLMQYSPSLFESSKVLDIPAGFKTTKVSKTKYYHISNKGILVSERNSK